jgi:superfamily II DNA or RNA helicase
MKLHDYQHQAVIFLREHRHAALFADPGLGKTVIILTWYAWAGTLTGEKAVIIAPLRVATSTWPEEVELWPHTRHLKYQVLHGKTRKIDLSNDLFFINPEGLANFFDQKESKQIRILVVDESSKFKNWSSQRTKLLRKHAKDFVKRIVMTCTPAPNGLLDLFSQAFVVDLGAAFGKSLGRFKETYFHAEKTVYINGRNVVASWAPNQGASEAIEQRMAPFTLRLDGEKLLSLPAFVETDIRFDIPNRKRYEQMEKELFTALEDGGNVMADRKSVV